MECANRGKQYRNAQLDSKQQDADRKAAEHLDTHRRDDEGRTGAAAVEHHPLGKRLVDFCCWSNEAMAFAPIGYLPTIPSSRMLPSSGEERTACGSSGQGGGKENGIVRC